MFTRGIIYDGIKYIEIINDLNNIRNKTLEDFVYCILIEISMNVNNQDFVTKADNYVNLLTNNIKFPRNDDFIYANILQDKSFLSQFNEWLSLIDTSFFNFESIPIYDTTIDLKDYVRFDMWIIDLINLKKLLIKRSNNLEMM
jgi:hypothetical protein